MRKKSRFTLVMMAVLLMFGMLGIQPAKPVQAAFASDLFFSEYIEGTYFNKAIEIFNGTGAPVDLSDYRLELYSNGAASSTASVDLSGTLVAGDVFVVAHPTADPLILAQADLTSISVINFSGDDAFALRKISTDSFADVIGQIGFRPTSGYWGSNPALTAERTLVRKADICAGDINGSDVFDPNSEWLGYPQNTLTYLGSHTSNCVLNEAEALSWLQGNTTLTGTLDALVATFPAVIPAVIVDAPYQINSRMILSDTLPVGSKVTIEISADGLTWYPYVTDVTLPGTSFWVTELFDPDATPADFDANYGGNVEHYRITVNGNPLEINTFLKVESIISKDEFATTTVLVELASIPVTFADDVAPEMVSVTPAKGLVTLAADQSFILKVKASDPNLYELEIDHSFEGTLPEFSVYADALNPWGTPEDQAQFEGAGVTVEYDALLQEWTIDFGEAITNNYFIPNGVTFYMVLIDEAGNTWGSMSPPTGENTFAYTFEVSNTLEPEITSAVTYVYTPVYEYVGAIAFDDPNNIFTATYSPAEFVAGGAMNDLARYLGALYRQNGSTVISIVYDGVTYTWDETGTLKGSNWEDASGKTLVSAMVADYLAAPADLVITVGDGLNTSDVTFRLLITNTLDDEIESAPGYVYSDYTYVGDYVFVDATNIYTVTYDDVEFNPNAMYDLARYLGALYRQDGSTVISIVYDGVTYTWDETGTLKGSNWEDASGNTLVSVVVAGIGSYDPAVGLVFTVSDGVHTENVTFKFVILDTIAPEVVSGVAKSASDGNVDLVDGAFTVDQGYVVDTIEITLDEDVLVALGTIVTMEGYGPYGTITANVDGVITITPYPGYETAALIGSFTFTVPDGSITDLAGNAFTGSIILNVLNVAPVAMDDAYTTDEDVVLDVPARGVLANDTDFDPTVLTTVKVTDPANGTLVLNADGSFTYTPETDFFGTDTFTYKANDGELDSNIATVTITVTDFKDQVIAVDDEYETDEDTTLTIVAPGVLANDIDVDLNIMTAGLVMNVEHGTLTLNGDGSFTYDPDPDFYGTDSFEYQLVTYPAVQSLWTDEATVTITVNPVGDAPVLGLIEDATIPELVEFSFTATATDVDLPAQVLTFSLVGAPDGAAIDAATGVFTWIPTEEQGPGVYTFTVKVCDDTAPIPLCDEQEVTLTVTEVNTAPVAQDLFETTLEDIPVDVTLVATDAEDDVLTYAIVDQPAHGTVTLVGTTATYTPELNFNGSDTFTYKANDGMADSNVATVTITVTSVNDAPVAVDDEYTVAEKETLTIDAPGVLGNDSDVDGDALSAILVDTVSNGTLTPNANGSFTYIPDEYFNGMDSFTYKASDGELESELAVVTITVIPVNDWPIANDDFYEVVTGTDLVKDAAEGILANDILLDPDEEVSIQILDEPQHGTLSMNDDGSFTYTPNPGYMGTDTFRYLVLSVRTINAEWSDDATVTITVKPLMRLFLPLILR